MNKIETAFYFKLKNMDATTPILIIGYVYRLTCNNPDLIYYGSTIQTLLKRFYLHKHDFKTDRGSCTSKTLFEVGGVEIELVLEVEVNSIIELREIEQTYIENDICVNKQRSFIAQEQRIQLKKERTRKYKQTDKGKERHKAGNNKYNNSEKGKETRKEYARKYRLKNKQIKDI